MREHRERARRIDDDDDDGNDDDDAVTAVNQVPQSHVHFCIFHAAARGVRDKFHASGKRFPFRGNQRCIFYHVLCDRVNRSGPFVASARRRASPRHIDVPFPFVGRWEYQEIPLLVYFEGVDAGFC